MTIEEQQTKILVHASRDVRMAVTMPLGTKETMIHSEKRGPAVGVRKGGEPLNLHVYTLLTEYRKTLMWKPNTADARGALPSNLFASRSQELAPDDGKDEKNQDGDDGDGDHPICSHP